MWFVEIIILKLMMRLWETKMLRSMHVSNCKFGFLKENEKKKSKFERRGHFIICIEIVM